MSNVLTYASVQKLKEWKTVSPIFILHSKDGLISHVVSPTIETIERYNKSTIHTYVYLLYVFVLFFQRKKEVLGSNKRRVRHRDIIDNLTGAINRD